MSVGRIREGPYYGARVFKENVNFLGTQESVRNRDVCVLERCP